MSSPSTPNSRLDEVFILDTDHRIIICRMCGFAIPPAQVQTHLLQSHQYTLTLPDRRAIERDVAVLSFVARSHAEVVYPEPEGPPVPGLPVMSGAYRCTFVDDVTVDKCQYVCRSDTGIKEHCKREHGWENQQKRGGDARAKSKETPNPMWSEGWHCQLFFKYAPWVRFFIVSPEQPVPSSPFHGTPGAEPELRDFFDKNKSLIESSLKPGENSNRPAAHQWEGYHWLDHLGISSILRGSSTDEIIAAVEPPRPGSDEVLDIATGRLTHLLYTIHSWCFDGPFCELSWPARQSLSMFRYELLEASGHRFRPFEHAVTEKTVRAYTRHASCFMAFFARMIDPQGHFTLPDHRGARRPEDDVVVTRVQRQKWNEIAEVIKRDYLDGAPVTIDYSERTGDRAAVRHYDFDQLDRLLMEFWMSILDQNVGTRRFQSSLICYCAMQAVASKTRAWKPPTNFNNSLSGVVWTLQLLMIGAAVETSRGNDTSVLDNIDERCRRYYSDHAELPMPELLRWRAYMFCVARHTVNSKQATWDKEMDSVMYDGFEVRMDDVTNLLAAEYTEARRILHDDLLLGVKGVPELRCAELKDQIDIGTFGFSLMDYRPNRDVVQGRESLLLSAVEHSPPLQQSLMVKTVQGYRWRDDAIGTYELAVQDFLQRLAVLVHIEAGSPLREPEFLSMTWQNGSKSRSIFIHSGRVMIHTTYHKNQRQMGRVKDNVRYLSSRVGEDLLLPYLAYVLPFRQAMVGGEVAEAAHLWTDRNGVWREGSLSRALKKGCSRASISSLTVRVWRQMSVAITKVKLARSAALFEMDDGSEEIDDDIVALAKQRNHSLMTMNHAYANELPAATGNVWDGVLQSGLRASNVWQEFWGLDETLEPVARMPLAKRLKTNEVRLRGPVDRGTLLQAARLLLRDEQLEWKSDDQARALEWSMMFNQLVVVLPTGEGKSLLFMLPCMLPEAGVTVVVVPLVALRTDLMRRLRDLGLKHMLWRRGERNHEGIVIVSVESAVTDDFMSYAKSLESRQLLDRIVVDECHLTLSARDYRQAMRRIHRLRDLKTRFVYVTATLPPSMESQFAQVNVLAGPRYVRAPTRRANITYDVERVEKACMREYAMSVLGLWDSLGPFSAKDKCIVYVRTSDECVDVAEHLSCSAFFGFLPSTTKADLLESWARARSSPFIVATTALAEGVDYPHVRLVVHVDSPSCLLTFSQGSGRAGRDGAPAWSHVFLSPSWEADQDCEAEPQPNAHPDYIRDPDMVKRHGGLLVDRYLTGRRCYREVLSEYLDSPDAHGPCRGPENICGVCSRKACDDETAVDGPTTPPARHPAGSVETVLMTPVSLPAPSSRPTFRTPADIPSTTDGTTFRTPASRPSVSVERGLPSQPATSSRASLPTTWTQPETYSDLPSLTSQSRSSVSFAATPATPASHRSTPVSYGSTPAGEDDSGVAGNRVVRLLGESEKQRYIEDLNLIRGKCVICRVRGDDWNHPFNGCSSWKKPISIKMRVVEDMKARTPSKGWLEKYTACYTCLNPQFICNPKERAGRPCEHPDIVLPACWAAYDRPGGEGWFKENFGRAFESVDAMVEWLGRPTEFAGDNTIQGVRVAALILQGLRLEQS